MYIFLRYREVTAFISTILDRDVCPYFFDDGKGTYHCFFFRFVTIVNANQTKIERKGKENLTRANEYSTTPAR